MSTWLAKLDPNVVVPVLVAFLTFLYHHLLSPAAQDKLAQRIADALATADTVLATIVAASPPGTTKADLEAKLWDAVKLQLTHVGLDVNKLPPAITSAVQAQVAKWLAQFSDAAGKAPPPATIASSATPATGGAS